MVSFQSNSARRWWVALAGALLFVAALVATHRVVGGATTAGIVGAPAVAVEQGAAHHSTGAPDFPANESWWRIPVSTVGTMSSRAQRDAVVFDSASAGYRVAVAAETGPANSENPRAVRPHDPPHLHPFALLI